METLAVSLHKTAGRRVLIHCHDVACPGIAVCVEVLERILLHLVRNAGQATSSGGSIAISARHLAGQVVVSVEDTGSGMSAFELANLLRRQGRRGHEGIGLVIVRMLVAGSGGAVRVVSREAIGTRVELFLPTVELFLPIAGLPRADDPVSASAVGEFLLGTPDPLAGGAMLWLHRGTASGNQKRIVVEPWTGTAGMLNNGRTSGGRGGVYVV